METGTAKYVIRGTNITGDVFPKKFESDDGYLVRMCTTFFYKNIREVRSLIFVCVNKFQQHENMNIYSVRYFCQIFAYNFRQPYISAYPKITEVVTTLMT